jgi:hypothetical protein
MHGLAASEVPLLKSAKRLRKLLKKRLAKFFRVKRQPAGCWEKQSPAAAAGRSKNVVEERHSNECRAKRQPRRRPWVSSTPTLVQQELPDDCWESRQRLMDAGDDQIVPDSTTTTVTLLTTAEARDGGTDVIRPQLSSIETTNSPSPLLSVISATPSRNGWDLACTVNCF